MDKFYKSGEIKSDDFYSLMLNEDGTKKEKDLKFFVVSLSENLEDRSGWKHLSWSINAEAVFDGLSKSGRIRPEVKTYYVFEIDVSREKGTTCKMDVFENLAHISGSN